MPLTERQASAGAMNVLKRSTSENDNRISITIPSSIHTAPIMSVESRTVSFSVAVSLAYSI
jgi:hypothetical protein